MRSFVIAALVALVSAGIWEDYILTYNRQFANAEEEAYRKGCFLHNLKMIDARNALNEERHSVNAFTDICPEEFKRTHHNLLVSINKTYNYAPLFSADEVAARQTTFDWRTKGAVTPVKDQAQCGSCWAFSSTGNMEGQWMLAGNPLVSLSEQELVSCSRNGNMGCSGGLMDNAFEWVIRNGGIDSEADYPYTSGKGVTGLCKLEKLKNIVAKFTSSQDIAKDENQMATWMATHGPLSVAVDAGSGWQTYHGGVMTLCKGRQLDHGVLAVGIGSSASSSYWIIKNSWGTTWGEQGYIRLAFGSNQCGINLMSSSIKV